MTLRHLSGGDRGWQRPLAFLVVPNLGHLRPTRERRSPLSRIGHSERRRVGGCDQRRPTSSSNIPKANIIRPTHPNGKNPDMDRAVEAASGEGLAVGRERKCVGPGVP